jgi:hypothetical protein
MHVNTDGCFVMISFVLAPAMGLGNGPAFVLSLIEVLAEGTALTLMLTVLAARYLFPMPQD